MPGGDWLVLIVEDDPIIAMLLHDFLRDLGCRAIGPAGSVAAALALIEGAAQFDGAVLDCNLGKEMVWPVADRLIEQKTPFVFSTGYGAGGMPSRFTQVPVLAKPYAIGALEHALIPQLQKK